MMLHELRREIQVTAVLRCNARIFRMRVKGQVPLLLSPLPIFKVGWNLGGGGRDNGQREGVREERLAAWAGVAAGSVCVYVCVCMCVCVCVCVCVRARASCRVMV